MPQKVSSNLFVFDFLVKCTFANHPKSAHFVKHHDSSLLDRNLFTDFEWFLRSFNISPIFDTEFSPCVRFFDQKRAAISSQASFQKNWFSLEGHCPWRQEVQFPSRQNEFFENLLGSLTQPFFDRNVERRAKIQNRRWGLCWKISKITQSW